MRRAPQRSTPSRSLRPSAEPIEPRVLLATFVVTNTKDDTNPGSLRYAITQSNATPGSNVIDFDIAGSGVQTIGPTSPLPAITVPVTIDATTEPGYSGTPLVVLNGTNAVGAPSDPDIDGLDLGAGSSTVEGLAIGNFTGYGINITAGGSDLIAKDFLGTNASGTTAEPNHEAGLSVEGPGGQNTITGDVVSGNTSMGIVLGGEYGGGPSTSGNLVIGNLIGTDVTGTKGLDNGGDGLELTSAPMTTIGGLTVADRNIISGNQSSQIADPDGNVAGLLIEGNFIGTDITGGVAIPNANALGLNLSALDGCTIGGSVAGAGNLISGVVTGGILIDGPLTSADVAIQGNLIGAAVTGTKLFPGHGNGLTATDVAGLTIGGTTPTARNLFDTAGSGAWGVWMMGCSEVSVQGNYLGTDITGTKVLGDGAGLHSGDDSGITIGGTTPGSANVISGSTNEGLQTADDDDALIEGNLIGTDVTDTKALGNGGDGIDLSNTGPDGITIGGTTPDSANVISANVDRGILISSLSGTDALIEGNLVGTDVTGTQALGNGLDGIEVASTGATIGGTAAGAGNVIAHNGSSGDGGNRFGMAVNGGCDGISILSNSIHDNASAGISLLESTQATVASQATITLASSNSTGSTITGTLTPPKGGTFSGSYLLQFFASPDLDAARVAEGQTLIGSATMTLSGTSASFSEALPPFIGTPWITATVTDPAGNTSVFSAGVGGVQAPVAPMIAASASSASVDAGGQVTDTFTITNPGSAAETGVAFSDPIPAGTTFVSGKTSTGASVTLSGGTATATIGTLAGGQSVTVTIVLATSTATPTSFTNTGGLTATSPVVSAGTDTASATTTVYTSADLSVRLSPPSATTTTGRLTFGATVTNAGPNAGSGATLTETFTLPSGATIVSESTTLGSVHASGDVVTASFGSLATGATASVSILIQTTKNGTIVDAANVSSSTSDPNQANNSASVPVRGVASVSMTSSTLLPVEEDQVTLNAYVTVTPGFPVATKTVTFYDGTTSMGTATLDSSGHASLVVALGTVGRQSLTAAYSGDANYAATTSTPLAIRVVDTPPGDYNGDGKSDLAVFDQTTATFTVLGSGGVARTQQLGNPADVNIPFLGDITGAGRDDFAVYDQTAAEFLILYPGGGLALPFGNPRDVNIPVAGDFDGDGKTNAAIYDQTTATFYVLEPNGSVRSQQLGNPHDVNIPIAGDYDGDGKTDFAIFDQTDSVFLVIESGAGTIARQFGNSTHLNIPIGGDFDGDGKTDLAVYDATSGVVLALESGGGTIFQAIGNPADENVPVDGDFDGDGKADIAIYDATAGTFLILDSGGGSLLEALGNTKHKILPL